MRYEDRRAAGAPGGRFINAGAGPRLDDETQLDVRVQCRPLDSNTSASPKTVRTGLQAGLKPIFSAHLKLSRTALRTLLCSSFSM